MTSEILKEKYLNFFKGRRHAVIPSASLVPQNDPTVLFTTAGMHPLVPYLLGQPHPEGKRLTNVQKCVRTDDINEVGDTTHNTFFEMLGNWSLGDYFKRGSIGWSFEFLTKELDLKPERLFVSCFAGDEDAPRDVESAKIWETLGIPKERIFFFPKKDNWWGPAGQTGPCGPDTEMYYDATLKPHGPDCRPGCACGRFFEIWNNVFMEYNKLPTGKFERLAKPNVDTGMGVERTTAVLNGLSDNYQTDLWTEAIHAIEELSGKKYSECLRPFRILADHVRATIFIIADGVFPSNKEQGYVLRRLVRRAIVQLHKLGVTEHGKAYLSLKEVFQSRMGKLYPEIVRSDRLISEVINDEVNRFSRTLKTGLTQFNRMESIDGKAAFDLFQTFGLPWELTAELASEKGIKVDREEFEKEFKKHQELSRTASAGMFKGGLADHSEAVTKYHSATHLLQAALRRVLGEHVHQEGSNITNERLRFDFSHPTKLTEEEVKKVEDLVNEQIGADLPRKVETMTYQGAIDSGALAFFKERYPEKVTVYSFGDFSREICGGPHVESTEGIGRIKVTKAEKIAAGTQRIYAIIAS